MSFRSSLCKEGTQHKNCSKHTHAHTHLHICSNFTSSQLLTNTGLAQSGCDLPMLDVEICDMSEVTLYSCTCGLFTQIHCATITIQSLTKLNCALSVSSTKRPCQSPLSTTFCSRFSPWNILNNSLLCIPTTSQNQLKGETSVWRLQQRFKTPTRLMVKKSVSEAAELPWGLWVVIFWQWWLLLNFFMPAISGYCSLPLSSNL